MVEGSDRMEFAQHDMMHSDFSEKHYFHRVRAVAAVAYAQLPERVGPECQHIVLVRQAHGMGPAARHPTAQLSLQIHLQNTISKSSSSSRSRMRFYSLKSTPAVVQRCHATQSAILTPSSRDQLAGIEHHCRVHVPTSDLAQANNGKVNKLRLRSRLMYLKHRLPPQRHDFFGPVDVV
ncbi:hypothetical protein DYB26_015955 [Aphanomyces astaci]|uniref:Uncharacterized protein n=1 Tax=Aphanomyces astaci TaxID=112090 RepID=A0A418EC31_APHAT|nr:hypothetical protein DYB26_015955 [Aphanomyces astaci]